MGIERNIESVKEYLDNQEWKYKLNEETNVFELGIGGLDINFESVRFFIHVKEHCVISYARTPLDVKEKARSAVAEFITRANYGLIKGNFEMDFNDGEIRYKHYVTSAELENDEDAAESLVLLPLSMYKRYGDALLQVMIGVKSPEEAVEEAESDNDDE